MLSSPPIGEDEIQQAVAETAQRIEHLEAQSRPLEGDGEDQAAVTREADSPPVALLIDTVEAESPRELSPKEEDDTAQEDTQVPGEKEGADPSESETVTSETLDT